MVQNPDNAIATSRAVITRILDIALLRTPSTRRLISGVAGIIFIGLVIINIFSDLVADQTFIRINGILLLFFVLIILEEVAESRAKISQHLNSLSTNNNIEVYENEISASQRQLEFIQHHNPIDVRMIEYSTRSIEPLLSVLSGSGSIKTIRILISHPEAAISEYQKIQRILSAVPILARKFPLRSTGSNLRVRCYNSSATIRGRNFDNRLIVVGWYTYDVRRQLLPDEVQIWGDENPVLIATVDTDQGEKLAKAFDEIFERLWHESEGLDRATRAYSSLVPGWPTNLWLRAVSRK